jgi:hypothetical protein
MSEDYNPKPSRWTRCIICGKRVTDEEAVQGCQRKRGGKIVAHADCWEKEQAERSKQ